MPEAQVDRFMLKVIVDYPSREEEKEIVNRMIRDPAPPISPVIHADALIRARKVVRDVYVDDKIKDYVLDIVTTTRDPAKRQLGELKPYIEFGASPRASIYLVMAARAHAFLKGRAFVTPEDIKQLAPDVLRHRIITTYEAEAEEVTSSEIIQRILDRVEVP